MRKLVDVMMTESDNGDKAAVALLLQLVLGLRLSEILSRQVRDIDDGGRVLWIPDGKTKNARRRLSVPEEAAAPGEAAYRQSLGRDAAVW